MGTEYIEYVYNVTLFPCEYQTLEPDIQVFKDCRN